MFLKNLFFSIFFLIFAAKYVMVNNFELIKNFIQNNYTLEEGDFFFVQILKRRKENPELKKDVSLIANYFLYAIEEFSSLEEDIIQICKENNARAYIRLNKRNDKKIALQTLKIAIDDIMAGTFKSKFDETLPETEPYRSLELIKLIADSITIKNFYPVNFAHLSACGQFASDPVKKWLIDLDDKSMLDEVRDFLNTITTVMETIPTKNGYHLITPGFNPNLFTTKYKDIVMQKDSPTILYL